MGVIQGNPGNVSLRVKAGEGREQPERKLASHDHSAIEMAVLETLIDRPRL